MLPWPGQRREAWAPRGRHIPLAMLSHLNGSPCRHWGATICHTEHFHGLALRSPLAMPVQHRGVHTLPGRVCVQTGVRLGQKPGTGGTG